MDARVFSRPMPMRTTCPFETITCPRGGEDCGGEEEGLLYRSDMLAHFDVCENFRYALVSSSESRSLLPAADPMTAPNQLFGQRLYIPWNVQAGPLPQGLVHREGAVEEPHGRGSDDGKEEKGGSTGAPARGEE